MLERINKTNDIKKLNLEDKKTLCNEIREYLIDTISNTGGHLASNLGVVELTIALESVFDVSKDKIVWDVGHQCYTHKILNGRKNELKKIRQYGGISGFPKVNESITDSFNTGHSSTSISAAMGMAVSRDLTDKDYNVIAVIGDGALTGGMALEALNHVGCAQTRMIIILNDNEMSISRNVSGMNKLLTHLRTRKNYRRTNKKGKKIVSSIPAVGKVITEVVIRGKNAVKQVFVPGMYFEEIGIKYLGPVDGHNIEDLENILNSAKDFDEPVLIHVLTKKGKGYKPAEDNPDKFHGVGKFNKITGEIMSSGKDDYSKVFGRKLVNLASKNKKIVAITAAMMDGTGLSSFATKYPDRFFDVGIAEEHALTFAAGLARSGMIPFVSIYSSFYQRGYDQVIHDICIQNLGVVMCVDRAGIVGNDGETHQGTFDLSFFNIIPNINIMAPKDFKELEDMLEYAVTVNKPIVIRYPRGGEEKTKFEKHEKIELGKAEILREGEDLTIIAIGKMVARGLEIADALEKDGIKSEVVNTRFLKPIDSETILKSIKKTKRVITIEDNILEGGLASIIKELIIDNNINTKIRCFGYPDKFIKHGDILEIEKKYGLDEESLIRNTKELLNNGEEKD